jgi:hypothetical protein
MKTAIVRSLIGIGKTEMGALTIGDFGKGRRRNVPHRVSWGESSYLVGEHVPQYARPLERLDFQRLSEGPEQRALTYTTLGLLLGEGVHEFSMLVGLPVEVQEDKETAAKIKRNLRGWLQGEHRYKLNGNVIGLNIKKVAPMTQPAGTWFAWGLDECGNWVKDDHLLQDASVAVCDIGFNTVDLFVVEGGVVSRRYTSGETLGVRRAVEVLSRTIKNRYEISKSLYEIDSYLRSDNPFIYANGERIDLTNLVDDAKRSASGGVLTLVDETWGNARQFAKALFTGGGAALFYDYLVDAYPLADVVNKPVVANAYGFAKYGRKYYADGEAIVGFDGGFGNSKAVYLTPLPSVDDYGTFSD